MRKNKYILVIIILLISIISNCQTNKYFKINTSAGKEYLFLNSDSTYNYTWYRFYDVGPINDTIIHTGKWQKFGDTLILESENKPDKYYLMFVNEKTSNENDSLMILINTNDSIPFFFISPNNIRINDKYYFIDKPTGNYVKFTKIKFPIKYIILAGYPIYYVKDTTSNYFEFTIKELTDLKDEYPMNTYFIEEKFLIKGDSLYHLRNNLINENNVFKRNNH